MENRRKFWNRFVSRLRRSSADNSYENRLPVRRCGCSIYPVPEELSSSALYSNFLRRGRSQLIESGSTNWLAVNNLRTPFGQNFTPKCLTEIDAYEILYGQGERLVDSISNNCWLENHLHRFGALSSNTYSSHISEAVQDNQLETDTTDSSIPENETRSAAISNHETFSDVNIRTRNNESYNNTQSSSSGSHLSFNSTVSDITHFYNSMNLMGPTFDSDAIAPQLPPYSELPDYPPPSYAEVFGEYSGGCQRTLSRRSSTELSCDIMY